MKKKVCLKKKLANYSAKNKYPEKLFVNLASFNSAALG